MVLTDVLRMVRGEVSGAAATRAVGEVARFHRIQASPGFRAAAEWVCEEACRAGLQARVLSFPADPGVLFWGARSFHEWEVRKARLSLIQPAEEARVLADVRDAPLHLVARSLPFHGEAELVVVDRGEEEVEYQGKDLRGKVVLARGNVGRVHDLAVVRRGAVGLVFDGMTELDPVRPTWALPDAVQYASFWWYGQEPRGFGFALSPSQGERVRRLAATRPLRVHATVDTRLGPGSLEVVEAFLPGLTGEEIVMVAHLCHPHPSANDNASGTAVLLEVARALASLAARGALPPLRRGIRFLWVPEITGSLAWLSSHEDLIPHLVAGLNLDMVGQDQDQCGGSLLVESSPGALPSFASTLLAAARDLLLPRMKTFARTGGCPLLRTADVPFSAGSDHLVFSDPTVGVPTPMVIQWPDRFYHTSADTPDRIDPGMMALVASLSCAYALWLACVGARETLWLVRELSARFRRRVIAELQEASTLADDPDGPSRAEALARIRWLTAHHLGALRHATKLAPLEITPLSLQDRRFAAQEYRRVAPHLPDRPPTQPDLGEEGTWVPRRLTRGPCMPEEKVALLDEHTRDGWWQFRQKVKSASTVVPTLTEYWIDGRRTVAQIASLIHAEMGRECGSLVAEYVRWLAELGLVEVSRKGAESTR